MSVAVVIGAQFGDEAKGKISDYLAANYRYVVRTGGGPNAGHSVHLPEGNVVLHQLACGVLRKGVTGISGPGMVVNPFGLEAELQDLRERNLLKGDVVLSDRAHLLLPLHEIEDGWEEALRSSLARDSALGTTRRGIGPAYADRYGRWGIRLADLVRPNDLASRLEMLYARKAHLPGLPERADLQRSLTELGGRLAPLIRPTEPILWGAIDRDEPILLEGAQSALLDVDFGTYPYVTSSHPTSAGALVGSGIPPAELDQVIGVSKAYATRVGAGPFPTEVEGEIGDYLRREGAERGATTGRPRRCGWLDLLLLRYATRLNGFTSLAITKVDVLGGLEEVPVCTQYLTPSGETLTLFPPSSADDLARVTPVYERFPVWPAFTERLKERIRREGVHALPPALKRFLGFISEQTRVPVEWVSYGPRRDETLWLGRGAPTHLGPELSEWSG
ncbi:MAG: adenylosuccinate synthase [Thermoplasmata archaeon]|nr:adenylosuccinate synthase [Thermoplasmata archaeon]MCI4359814.1 adenylosuccinate synthase [Thermoplasmata archaeon]